MVRSLAGEFLLWMCPRCSGRSWFGLRLVRSHSDGVRVIQTVFWCGLNSVYVAGSCFVVVIVWFESLMVHWVTLSSFFKVWCMSWNKRMCSCSSLSAQGLTEQIEVLSSRFLQQLFKSTKPFTRIFLMSVISENNHHPQISVSARDRTRVAPGEFDQGCVFKSMVILMNRYQRRILLS